MAGSCGPLCGGDQAISSDIGLRVFGACVRSLYDNTSAFLHNVVVHQEVAVRNWCSWMLEDPLVHPYRWLRPDFVPSLVVTQYKW